MRNNTEIGLSDITSFLRQLSPGLYRR